VPDGQPPDRARYHRYPDEQREAVYRVIAERRDVRQGFLADPVPDEVLCRVLEAAHLAPSVGFSQPWDFIVITDRERRERIAALARGRRDEFAADLPGARARAFDRLKIESILDTPVNIAVTCDRTRGGRHTLGRHVQPQTAAFSSVLAVANLWLAARAEGLGVGWVSFFGERELAAELGLPDHLEVIAYLCLGYVSDFAPEPELATAGWARRRPLSWAVHAGEFGRRGLPGSELVDPLAEVTAAIAALGLPDEAAMAAAAERQDRMIKPRGSLGALEEVSVRLAGLAGRCPPPLPEPACVAIFAGDHGVHAQGVTPWPQEVTAQMVANFLAGGAVVNAFAAQVGAEVTVVDVGVAGSLEPVPGLLPRKIAPGTADFTVGPAMTREQAVAAVTVGLEIARDLVAAGNRCLITGDMGIANTTASAALVCAFTGADPAEATGRGTGIDAATFARKVDVVRRGLALHRAVVSDRAAQADPAGVPAHPAGVLADPVGVLADPVGVLADPVGVPADPVGVPADPAGVLAGPAGPADPADPVGVPADPVGVPADPAGVLADPVGVPADPVGVLAAFGGFEHAALAGFILGAAALRVPVILDGVIAGAAALAAAALAPGVTAACFAGHRSVEPGHALALDHLGLSPLVDLGLRLGEGTGALLALPLLASAARALRDVATFDSAGVTEKP
jgi:nicotinate-nucleotide--dimethylbenzimidazole phosphoribosyltransferase